MPGVLPTGIENHRGRICLTRDGDKKEMLLLEEMPPEAQRKRKKRPGSSPAPTFQPPPKASHGLKLPRTQMARELRTFNLIPNKADVLVIYCCIKPPQNLVI